MTVVFFSVAGDSSPTVRNDGGFEFCSSLILQGSFIMPKAGLLWSEIFLSAKVAVVFKCKAAACEIYIAKLWI